MNIHWNFKIFADSAEQVLDVFQTIASELSLDAQSYEIEEYPKFTTQLFTLRVESLMDARNASLLDVDQAFRLLGTPMFVNENSNDNVDCYEAMFDSRKHLATIPEVFWARVYVEKRIKNSTA